jgi:hypothetical protein
MPRVIRVDDPSGPTSHSLALTCPNARSDATRNETEALPSTSVGRRAASTGQSQQSERALSARWSRGCPHGSAPPHEFHAATPTSPSTRSSSTPVGATATSDGDARRRPRPEIDPSAGVEREIVRGHDRLTHVHLPRRRRRRWRPAAQVLVEEGDDLGVVVDVRAGPRPGRRLVHPRPGEEPPRQPVALVLLDRPGTSCCGSRRPSRRSASSGTPSARTRRRRAPAGSTRAARSGPSVGCSSHSTSQAGVPSTRRSHSARHASRSPSNAAGVGGRAFIATM